MLKLFAPVLIFGLVGTAQAQDSAHWKSVGSWEVYVDKSLNFGCFLIAAYTRGTVVRIGLDQKNLNGYVMIGNEAWRSLQVGKQYELRLQFDSEGPWRG